MQWMQYAVDTVEAVCSGGSGIVVCDGGAIVCGAKNVKPVDTVHNGDSMQWTQYTVDAVEQWYMVVGTLSLVQKGQTSGHNTQWMQWISGHSTQ